MRRTARAGSPEIVKVVGDSSPSAAETSFRVLDDVFLQTQTRIWLGEVLHVRFDEETAIADLLADGELLFQVSKVVWKMLLKKHAELKHSNICIHDRTSFGKSKGKYMPYPKVDSFLKICQILGLTGIDLFTPSDVVEKRDVRRVCMCIRSFSMKARSKNLQVPDFDIVTYTIAMPTNFVGGLRRNLERSQYSSTSSNGYRSSSMEQEELHRQKSSHSLSSLHYDSCSESDEAESTFTEFEFQSPNSNASYDYANFSSIVQHDSFADGNLSEPPTQSALDTHEQVEIEDNNNSHKLKDGLQCESLVSCTECQFDQGVEAFVSPTGEVISPLGNTGNIVEIRNADISSDQNFASTDIHCTGDFDAKYTAKNSMRLMDNSNDVNAEGKNETSSGTHQTDFINYIKEVPSEVNIIELQEGTSEFICYSIDNGNDSEMPAKSFDLSLGSSHSEHKVLQSGSILTDVKDVEVSHVCSTPSDTSLEDHCAYNDHAANPIYLSQGHNSKEAGDQNTSNLLMNRKHSVRVGSGSSHTIPSVCLNGYTRESTRSCDTGIEHSSFTFQNFVTDCHTASSSGLGSVTNSQILPSWLDSGTVSESNSIESKICSDKHSRVVEEVDRSSASPCEMDVEQVNSPVTSIMDEVFRGNTSLIEKEACNGTTLSASENQLISMSCSSETEGIIDRKITEENAILSFPYDMHRELIDDSNEKLSIQYNSSEKGSSIQQLEDASYRSKSSEQIGQLMVNGSAEREVLLSSGPWLIDRMRNEVLQTGEMNSSDKCSDIQSHTVLHCSAMAGVRGRQISTEECDDTTDQGDAHVVNVSGTINQSEETTNEDEIQEPEKLGEELLPVPEREGKGKETAKRNQVLKSVAGAVTLLGALFLFRHVRHRREKEQNIEPNELQQNPKLGEKLPGQKQAEKDENTEPTATQINVKPGQEFSQQEKADAPKPQGLYPADKLKF